MLASSSLKLIRAQSDLDYLFLPNGEYIDSRAPDLFTEPPPVCNFGPFVLDDDLHSAQMFAKNEVSSKKRILVQPTPSKGKCTEVSFYTRNEAVNGESTFSEVFNMVKTRVNDSEAERNNIVYAPITKQADL